MQSSSGSSSRFFMNGSTVIMTNSCAAVDLLLCPEFRHQMLQFYSNLHRQFCEVI